MFFTRFHRAMTYYGKENSYLIKRSHDKPSNKIKTLDELFDILLHTWQRETAYPACQTDPAFDINNDPSYGQCAITAMLVYDMFGGTIHRLRNNNGGTHYFNKIDGYIFDLTSDQFTLYNEPLDYTANETIARKYYGTNKDTASRYQLLINNITTYIK